MSLPVYNCSVSEVLSCHELINFAPQYLFNEIGFFESDNFLESVESFSPDAFFHGYKCNMHDDELTP